MAKKDLRHGNRFAARVRRRYFSEGEGEREATTGNAFAVRRLTEQLSNYLEKHNILFGYGFRKGHLT